MLISFFFFFLSMIMPLPYMCSLGWGFYSSWSFTITFFYVFDNVTDFTLLIACLTFNMALMCMVEQLYSEALDYIDIQKMYFFFFWTMLANKSLCLI